jgi:hypothetical protein
LGGISTQFGHWRLYNSAVNSTLVLDLGHALFVGTLGAIPEHRASASALLVGIDGPFDLMRNGGRQSHRMACVASQTLHALDSHGRCMAVFYFEPGTSLRQPLPEVSILISAIELALSPDHHQAWLGLLSQIHIGEAATTCF